MRARSSFGDVLDGSAQRGARHRRGARLDERDQARRVDVAGRTQHPAQRLLHERLGIVGERLGEGVRIVELASLQEREGRHERGAPLGPEIGCREPRQRRAVAVDQIAADDVTRGEVDEVPLVDAVVAAQVQLVELGSAIAGRAAVRRRLAHDAARERAHLVRRLFEQRLELSDGQVECGLGELEHGAHAHADEGSGGVGREVAGVLLALLGRGHRLERGDERRRIGHPCPLVPRALARASIRRRWPQHTRWVGDSRRIECVRRTRRGAACAQAARCAAGVSRAASSAADSSRPKAG